MRLLFTIMCLFFLLSPKLSQAVESPTVVQIVIYDIDGEIIKTLNSTELNQSGDINSYELEKGYYFLEVHYSNNKKEFKKFHKY